MIDPFILEEFLVYQEVEQEEHEILPRKKPTRYRPGRGNTGFFFMGTWN